MAPVFEISIADRQSALWQRYVDYLQKRLEELRKLNDHDATEVETALLRGRIAEVKTLLSINDDESI